MKSNRDLKKALRQLKVKEPGTSEETVSQQKLRNFEALEDQLRALQKKFYEQRSEMRDVIRDGASVTTGKRGLESGIRFRRHPKYKQALIDKLGEDYQQKVLNATEYKPYFYVRLISRNGKKP